MIERRAFLKWGAAAPIFLSQQLKANAANATPQNTLVVVDELNQSAQPERVAIVLNAFARKGLPVTCLVELSHEAPATLAPNQALLKVLKKRLAETPGLIQVVPLVRDLGNMSPYFQARATYDARQALQNALWGEARKDLKGAPSQTIACDMLEQAVAPSGVRASGVRNILMRPKASRAVTPQAWEDGVVRVIGGQRATLRSPQNSATFHFIRPVERVLYLAAQDFGDTPLARLETAASLFADSILKATGEQWMSPILASDLQFRDAYAYKRQVALHFVLETDATPQDLTSLNAFRLELNEEGLFSSFSKEEDPNPQGEYWVALQKGASSDGSENVRPLTKEEIRFDTRSPSPRSYGITVAFRDQLLSGLNSHNTLNLPTVQLRDGRAISQTVTNYLGAGDCVLAVSAKLLRLPAYRKTLKDALYAIKYDGISNIVTLPTYVRNLVPTGPYITHFRRAQAYRGQTGRSPQSRSSEERAQLMADAKIAWSYFEKWTNPKTGLCPATANSTPGQRRLHEAVTMWDVGSHIFALMAAVDLELISPRQFQNAIGRILPNIAGRRSQGRLLPQGWIATDKFKWGTKDFDGCDAGRLLSALYNLDMHPLARPKAASTVRAWDLENIVKGGIVYSVEDGELASTFKSHCAHYAAWAFRTWGIEVLSPYEVLQGKSRSDGEMKLLEVAGRIGPLGAEPLLMEALEFGMSAESSYLAEVLFAAQLEEYDETSRLICVSEGPINSPPWFLYQGLQFDAPGRVWATDTVAGLSAHRTKAFGAEHRSISSKGAYLWSAYREHPFCDRLRDLVREKAQTPYGFASSINEKTGEASRNYSDINTNAVILQSIAHLLKTEA